MTTAAHGTPGAAEVERLRARIAALEASERERAELLIEIGRLRGELQERLDEQTATAEILRAVGRTPADSLPVFGTIAQSAARLCGADSVAVYRVRGDVCVAHANWLGAEGARLANAFNTGGGRAGTEGLALSAEGLWTTSLTRDTPPGRAISDLATLLLPDLAALSQADGFEPRFVAALQRALRGTPAGTGTLAVVPLLRESDGAALGALAVRALRRDAFAPSQIALLETFAAQAVIAIENTRLFSELQERLEEQTATSDILRVIAESTTDPTTVMQTILDRAVRLCGASDGTVRLFEGDEMVHVATVGDFGQRFAPGSRQRITRPRGPNHWQGRLEAARAIWEQRTLYHPDTRLSDEPNMAEQGILCQLYVPLPGDEEPLGFITIRAKEANAFSPSQIALVETFARQAAIAVKNTQLFTQLQNSNATLKEALEQQTATAEVLRIIASSPTDLQGVLNALAERALALTASESVVMYRGGRDSVRAVARAVKRAGTPAAPGTVGVLTEPQSLARLRTSVPQQAVPGWAIGRAILEKAVVALDDAQAAEDLPVSAELAARIGYRSLACVPLLREGDAIGAFSVVRMEVRPFSAAEIGLLQSFADQAVIAIENTRLFSELRERDERRQHELERASAIQQRLLPSLVEGWPGVLEVAVRFRPAVETSGDFYDVHALTAMEGATLPSLQIAVGDVAGKGMSAALVTALARNALRSTAFLPAEAAYPSAALRLAGKRLHRDVGSAHFVACALAVIQPPGRHHRGPRLRLANAAQVPVLLARYTGTEGAAARELEPPGYRLPLGSEDDGDYKDVEVDLQAGDVVVFSSDGLVEAPLLPTSQPPAHLSGPSAAGELFGFARLAASASHWTAHAPSAESVAEGIWSDLTAWCGDQSHHDDVTLLVLRVPGGH